MILEFGIWKGKIPAVLQCQKRRMIVLVVMADVLTCSHFYIWGESFSRGLISQTFSPPMLLLCFYSITCTITDRWGLLSKDKAGVISPPGLAWHTDRSWELHRNPGFSDLNGKKSKISSIKGKQAKHRHSSFIKLTWHTPIFSTPLTLNPWHRPCTVNSSAKLR